MAKKVVTERFKIEAFADGVVEREYEVHYYAVNKANYEKMLLSLPPDVWPDELKGFRGCPVEQLPLDMDDTMVQLIADYQHRDHLRTLVRTENAEMRKSQRVLDALKVNIPEADLDAEIENAMLRRDERVAAAEARGRG